MEMAQESLKPYILMVDDRQENLFALEKILRRVNAHLISANSGNEALSLILRHRFALILLDVQMEGMDGFETATYIREYEQSANTPIIFVTAINKDQKYVFQGYQNGAVDYLFKPLDPDILISKVNIFLKLYEHQAMQERLIRKLQVAKAKLSESEIRIHSILNNIQDGVVTTDSQGAIHSFNLAAEKMFQYTFAEVVEKPIAKLLDEDSGNIYQEVVQSESSDSIKRNLVSGQRVLCRRKDGRFFPAEIGISKITIDGKPLFTSSVRDITQRQVYETKLIRAKEEALRANQAKSDFLASMSHELRTPLNAIIGFSTLIMRCSQDSLSESQEESLFQIQKAGEHLLSLINDILDLAKIDSGKTTLSIEPLCVKNLVREVGDLIQNTAQELDIRIEIVNNCLQEAYILGDNVRAKQVLLNLMSNGIKYNKPKGMVQLKCEPDSTSNDRILFSISDTGIGISPENLENIFEPFDRGGAEGSEIEGTGIGLSITKKLIAAMNGSITVTSTLGKGSCFEISLPMCPNAEEIMEAEELAAESQKPNNEKLPQLEETLTLLYVEDNPANLKLLQKFFESAPQVRLETSASAESGLKRAAEVLPDIILMDINLPGMNGYEACRLLKQDGHLCNIPVIGLSANAMKSDREKAINSGFDGYITKPIDFNELTRLLKDLAPR